MQFTRQPIIETIITPKEGYKLQVRSVRADQGAHQVDALELVLFGTIPFYRSLEGLSPFLVPAANFEIEQVRETRAQLKHAVNERAKSPKESHSKDAKKGSSVSSRDRQREPKRSEAEASDGDGNWERRKRLRKRHPTDDGASKGSKEEYRDSIPSESQDPAMNLVPSPPMVKTYDLVPPPTRLVAEAMTDQVKGKVAMHREAPIESQPEPSALDAVEAILRSSAPVSEEHSVRGNDDDFSNQSWPVEPPEFGEDEV